MESDTSHETMSDEAILAQSIKEPAMFSLIVDRYGDAFLRRARGIVRSHEDAQDVVQEVFAKIYRYAGSFHAVPGATFRSWAYKILMNTALTHVAKQRNERARTVSFDPEMYEDVVPDLGEIESRNQSGLSDAIRSVLVRMPTELARVLSLHFLDGRPQQEIASIEGISLPAVKTRVFRAKRLFRSLTGGEL